MVVAGSDDVVDDGSGVVSVGRGSVVCVDCVVLVDGPVVDSAGGVVDWAAVVGSAVVSAGSSVVEDDESPAQPAIALARAMPLNARTVRRVGRDRIASIFFVNYKKTGR
jgi:hypothetical protein